MNALHAINDGHLLDAIAADLNAAVYEVLVREETDTSFLEVDPSPRASFTDALAKSVQGDRRARLNAVRHPVREELICTR